jgi:hypothetical protein
MKRRRLSFAKRAITAYLVILAGFAFAIVILAYIAVWRNYLGSLSYLAYPFTALSAAGGAILPAYFSKSAKENTAGGIVYDAAKARDFETI